MNKLDLFTRDYQYFINEKKGIVVAKLPQLARHFTEALCRVNIPNEEVITEKYWIYTAIQNIESDIVNKELNGLTHLTAKAVCAEGDEFDVEIGKKLAKQRLQIKVLNTWRRLHLELGYFYALKMEDHDEQYEKVNDVLYEALTNHTNTIDLLYGDNCSACEIN